MLQRRIGMIWTSSGWAVSMSPRANSRADRILRLAVVARPISNAECRTTTVERSTLTLCPSAFYFLPSTFYIPLSGFRPQAADVCADRDRGTEDRLDRDHAEEPVPSH